MHVHFEQNTCTRTDSDFLSLSWMGKVPEDLPEEGGGWKLDRSQYYVEGWLASGNMRGVVGVTFSTSHCHGYDAPPRSNFNLRGHRSEVVLVRWNEPYQKLATCDSLGVIFVWIKHEGRWSIELINDRNSQVTDFAWSHDGRMALICYRDGFILVGSVAGQRYWSSMLNLDSTCITCGVWSPDDSQVMFGTMDGKIIVMSSAGTVITQVVVHEGFEITSLAWSCERFNMEEAEAGKYGGGVDYQQQARDRTSQAKSHVLAVCFKYGDIFLMSGYDDICPVMVYTTLTGMKIDWSNCGEYLAVGGFVRLPNLQCRNEVHFYSKDGSLIHWVNIPSQGKPLTAMTWGHNDKRLFAAAGRHLYVAWVSKQVAPLQFLSQRVVHRAVRSERAVERLPLPQRLRCGVKALFSPTIKSYIPDPLRLREFVCSPPPGGERLFCTMIRHGEETSGGHYTLYLEYLGGLVPLLKGKRASKLRPDFVIFDPKIKSSSSSSGKAEQSQQGGGGSVLAAIESDTSSESDSEVYMDGCGSPRMQRRRRLKTFRAEKVNRSITFRTLDELMYDDNLPETNRLVEVTSNIWATKFQMTGVASCLPSCLGQVVYKTSLLRLQPRQMTVSIAEVTPSRHTLSRDPNFSAAPVSDDEDSSLYTSEGDLAGERKTVEVTVHDANLSLLAEVTHFPRDTLALEVGRRSSAVDSPLIESSSPTMNGVDIPLTALPAAVPVPCVGGGGGVVGVGVVAGKLGGSGTVRSRSLSPVRNSLTQTMPAFKQDGVGAGDSLAGDHHTLLLSSTNGCGGGWQGARPKANDSSISSSNPNSNIVLSPVVSCNSSAGGPGTFNRRTGSSAGATTYAGGRVSGAANPPHTTSSSNIIDSYSNPATTAANSKPGSVTCSNSNNSNSKCSTFPTTPSPHFASSQYAISNSGPSHPSRVETSTSCSASDTTPSLQKRQDSSLPDVKRASKTCFRGGLDLGVVPAQAGNLELHITTDPNSCSNTPRTTNTQNHEHSSQFGWSSVGESPRWADPAAEAVHLLLEDSATSAVGQHQREECGGHRSQQTLPSLPHQSTLVADCSPTAPYSSDIHRRLYLAQHSFLPDSGAPISPSGCPSCLPSHLCYREDLPTGQSADLHNPRLASVPHSTVPAASQLPDSVVQNNLKNASPPSVGYLSRRPCHRGTGSPLQEAWSAPPPQHATVFHTTSALAAVAADVPSTRVHGPEKPLSLYQYAQSDKAENLQHSDSASASSLISSSSTCLPSVLPNLLSFPSFSKCPGSSASNHASGEHHTGCWISPPTSPHTNSEQEPARETVTPSSETCRPSTSSSLDKLALILSEEPSTQHSSHNFRAMPGFVMRNPDLPESDTSDSGGFNQHHRPDQTMANAQYNGFLSPPPSPPAVLHGNSHLSHDLDIQIQATSASLPSSPIRFGRRDQQAVDATAVQQELLKGRCKHLSPLLGRKALPQPHVSSSSQDILGLAELRLSQQYESLEMFQKAQLRQKMRRRLNSANGRMEQSRMFTMHNKAPLWNETSQVYQLDFGGRVTQESAKNFQIELKGKQVMQFGRIDNHAYTLDFQYPFTAVQAFAVALANVTQRLK